MNGFLDRHRSATLVAAAVVPVVVAAALAPLRDAPDNSNAVLVLVLLVVGAASTGIRPAGVIAALSSALWSFDFFLTAPFHRLSISDPGDIETAVMLVLVGVAVTEVALWGRRQQGVASRQQGYLSGVLETVESVAVGGVRAGGLTERVAAQEELLSLDSCRFQSDLSEPQYAQLTHDGTALRAGHPVDVARSGLPTDTEIELQVRNGGAG